MHEEENFGDPEEDLGSLEERSLAVAGPSSCDDEGAITSKNTGLRNRKRNKDKHGLLGIGERELDSQRKWEEGSIELDGGGKSEEVYSETETSSEVENDGVEQIFQGDGIERTSDLSESDGVEQIFGGDETGEPSESDGVEQIFESSGIEQACESGIIEQACESGIIEQASESGIVEPFSSGNGDVDDDIQPTASGRARSHSPISEIEQDPDFNVEAFRQQITQTPLDIEVDDKPQATIRREVYKMPTVDTPPSDSPIFWPANFVVLAVAWQLRVIYFTCSAGISLLVFLYSLVIDPVQKTSDVRNKLSQRMKPLLTDLAPKLGGYVKRFGWAVLAVTHVVVILGFLVLPVLLVEYFYVTKFIEEPLDIKAPLFFNYTEARPSASFGLGQFLATGKTGGGEEKLRQAPSFSWYKLHVALSLTLPESDYNRQLGMFQVAAEILSARNELVARSNRPCMLRFQSVPIRYARTLIYSVPLLLDVAGEYQVLKLDMMELRQQSINPVRVASINVFLEPRAGFGPGAGLPELYASEIRVRAELPWKKSMVYKWKRTVYVWSAMLLFFLEIAIILCCFRRLLIPKKSKVIAPAVTATPRRPRSQVKKRVTFQET